MQLPRATRLFIRIRGELQYLWRAVDRDGVVLDILMQGRRDAGAAERLGPWGQFWVEINTRVSNAALLWSA